MNSIFINLSNHNSTKWDIKQINAAKAICNNGPIIDIQFPTIDPELSTEEIKNLAYKYFNNIIDIIKNYEAYEAVIHIMGEMTFTFNIVKILNDNGYFAYASTTKRNVIEKEDGTKISTFEFVQFRQY